MINIMDIASRYLPDLEKLAAGISSQYSLAQSTDSSDDAYHRRRRRKVKKGGSKMKKKRTNLILLKKKLKLPRKPPAYSWDPYSWAFPPKVTHRLVKTANKGKSKLRKITASKTTDTRKPEKLLGMIKLDSASKMSIKNKTANKAIAKNSALTKVDKALMDFKKKKIQFISALKILRQALSHMTVPSTRMKTDEDSTATETTVSKRKKKRAIKENRRRHKPATSSATSNSTSSSSSSNSSSSSSCSESTSSSEPSSSDSPSSTSIDTKTCKKAELRHVVPKSKEPMLHVKEGCPLHNLRNSSLIPAPPDVFNNLILADQTPKGFPNPLQNLFFNSEIKSMPPNKEEMNDRIYHTTYATKQPLFRVRQRQTMVQRPVRTSDEILKEAERPSHAVRSRHRFVESYNSTTSSNVNSIQTMKEYLPKCTVYRGRQ